MLSFSRNEWKQGVLDALPIGMSFILFGGIFGMLALKTGMSLWESFAMSLFVFAGSAQFTALSMLSEQVNLWSIVLATLLLNSRHLLMGLSMAPYYKNFSNTFVNVMAFFLVDEQYAVTLNRFQQNNATREYILAASFTLYFTWNLGTVLGGIIGKWIPDPNDLGLGFSFTAMFLALAYYQLTSLLRILTFVISGVLAIFSAILIPNGLHLLIVGIFSFMIGYFYSPSLNDLKQKTIKEADLA